MSRLIDADKLMTWFNDYYEFDEFSVGYISELIKEQPTIEPRKGKWIKISPANIYECSVCGQNVMTNDIETYKFCHGCGADLRGEEDEEA